MGAAFLIFGVVLVMLAYDRATGAALRIAFWGASQAELRLRQRQREQELRAELQALLAKADSEQDVVQAALRMAELLFPAACARAAATFGQAS